MKIKQCLKCGKKVSKNCKLGFCSTCRNRSGKNNPFYGKKHSKETIERIKIETTKKSKELWKNTGYRQKVIQGISKPRKEKFKQEQSERIKQWYIANPIQKELRSQQMKNSWSQGLIEPTINSINESKNERELRETLKKLLPQRNVRKTKIKVYDKWFYPDIRIDENIIIEFFGDYWHANPKKFKPEDIVHHKLTAKQIWEYDKKRIDILQSCGFIVIIIWQNDFKKNKDKIFQEILEKISKND